MAANVWVIQFWGMWMFKHTFYFYALLCCDCYSKALVFPAGACWVHKPPASVDLGNLGMGRNSGATTVTQILSTGDHPPMRMDENGKMKFGGPFSASKWSWGVRKGTILQISPVMHIFLRTAVDWIQHKAPTTSSLPLRMAFKLMNLARRKAE